MRLLLYLSMFSVLVAPFQATAEEPLLSDLVEAYLKHPDFIAQNCYTNPPCCNPCPSSGEKKESYYFEVPKGGSTQYYYEIPGGFKPSTFVDLFAEASPPVIGPDAANTRTDPTPVPKPPKPMVDSDPASRIIILGAEEGKEGASSANDVVQGRYKLPQCDPGGEGFTVNFENIAVVELLQFISRISGINFIFDAADLQFNITIVSQEAASVPELTSALMQILKMHSLNIAEQGNTVIIYKQQNLSRVSKIITDLNVNESCDAAVITRVFKLYNVDPVTIAEIVKPLLSVDAIVEVSKETRHLVISDITYNVDKIAQLLNALDMPNTMYEVGEYRVQGAYPEALVAYAKEILAPLLVDNPMQMIAQPSAGKIFVVSTPYLINKALQLLSSLDSADVTDVADLPASSMANNSMYMYKLKYQPGKDIATALQTIGSNLEYTGVTNLELVNAIYSSQFLQVNNSIVITGTQGALEKIISLLDNLDRPPKQVYLEVLILDTTLTNSLDFGVQWIGLGNDQDKLAYATGLLSNNPGGGPVLQGGTSTNPGARYVAANGSPPPLVPNPGRDVALPTPTLLQGFTDLSNATEAFGFGIIGNILSHKGKSFLTLGALISALEEEESSKLVLNPRIMVQDTQSADIFVGENIPYQTTSSIIQQTGSVTQNIQYEDVGVHLQITPTIAPNNIVSLDINQTIATVVSATGTLTPTTTKTLTTTRLHVPDGCFLVMSGHIQDQVTCIRSGIPCLGTLPLIGPTFSRNVDQRQKRNLIMFIRPKVLTNIAESLELTNQEGYDSNWQENPNSMIQCGPMQSPECETYPAPRCPPN